ncbi:hypothetical protein AB0940_31520 [Streptomyces sp. NPDC006656]|uniref:hypothetical protein n=1 Tax=Streptomyces sp. NPDC006656 TaxID=3156899 RepID=UPI0034573490
MLPTSTTGGCAGFWPARSSVVAAWSSYGTVRRVHDVRDPLCDAGCDLTHGA